jgi:hypothetical protein
MNRPATRRTLTLLWLAKRALLASGATSIVACAATSTPRTRVAKDLGCAPDATRVARVEPGPRPGQTLERWQVSGCGKAAVYLCTVPVRDCWREGERTTLSVR